MKLGQKMMKSYALDVVFIHVNFDNLIHNYHHSVPTGKLSVKKI